MSKVKVGTIIFFISLAFVIYIGIGLPAEINDIIESQKAVQQAEKEVADAHKDVQVARENLERVLEEEAVSN